MFFLLITHFFHRKMRIFGKKEFYDQIILWILSIHNYKYELYYIPINPSVFLQLFANRSINCY